MEFGVTGAQQAHKHSLHAGKPRATTHSVVELAGGSHGSVGLEGHEPKTTRAASLTVRGDESIVDLPVLAKQVGQVVLGGVPAQVAAVQLGKQQQRQRPPGQVSFQELKIQQKRRLVQREAASGWRPRPKNATIVVGTGREQGKTPANCRYLGSGHG